ncbi:hypothetical protein BB560_004137, partial [Smittium megazygosporum]
NATYEVVRGAFKKNEDFKEDFDDIGPVGSEGIKTDKNEFKSKDPNLETKDQAKLEETRNPMDLLDYDSS